MNCHKTAIAIGRALFTRAAVTGPKTTSSTSLAISAGTKTFTVGTGQAWLPGMAFRAQSAAAVPSGADENFLAGTVVSYSGTTLVTAITVASGSGAHADWQLSCGFHIYAHDVEILATGESTKVAELQLPAIHVTVTGESLCGSATVGKMKTVLLLGSQSDAETSAIHSARETALRSLMTDPGALAAAFAATGGVQLKGMPKLITNDPGVEARAFVTPLTYIAGVEEC
jgi:fermentation-respiration switch protein FrsA (DUF1100 family)